MTVNSHTENVEEAIGDRRFDVVVDAVGSVDIIKQGSKFMVPGGLVGIYGVLHKGPFHTGSAGFTEQCKTPDAELALS